MYARNYARRKNLEVYQMIKDPIVEEVRRFRKEHAAKYGNNLKCIVKSLRDKERKSEHTLLNPGPRLLLKKAVNQH